MRTVLTSTTVLFTILLSLTFGIACGYAIIIAILRAFSHRPQPAQRAPVTPAVATTASNH